MRIETYAHTNTHLVAVFALLLVLAHLVSQLVQLLLQALLRLGQDLGARCVFARNRLQWWQGNTNQMGYLSLFACAPTWL